LFAIVGWELASDIGATEGDAVGIRVSILFRLYAWGSKCAKRSERRYKEWDSRIKDGGTY
jgi:hypothetical protein